jgi:hypothetical protein
MNSVEETGMRLHLASPRLARGMRVSVRGAPVLAATVNGMRQADPAWQNRQEETVSVSKTFRFP